MQQHPVPQPITSYEFRLVGDMTLKQFSKLAAGAILAFFVYVIGPPALIKWFLILLFGSLGAAMAFVPFEGRPIDTWIIAFFKRIYSPTQYVWRQNSQNALTQKAAPPSTAQKLAKDSPLPQPTPATQSIPASQFTPPVVQMLGATPASGTPLEAVSGSQKAAPVQDPKVASTTIFKAPPPQGPKPPTVEAKFAPDMTIPATPSLANLLTGYAHDPQGKLIEGAILEIRDSSGIPVRAFKTNKLGQFISATPLPDGEYEIETEKDGFSFDIIKVKLKGDIVPPIEIVSK